ncbi:MAG: MBL fold metallo-hydrolase, partial [Bacillota bacterium]|nr:MBL fold metallo-hydrolase [Bacillota bacterium]
MKVGFCGGAAEVGASCIMLNLDGKNIILDCGMRIGSSKEYLPDLGMIQENGGVHAIVISHAHMDHTGSLPVLSREYPEAKIYMTHATKDLVRVLLYDSLKIMEYREAEIPVFAEVHVKNMLDRIICFSPGFTFHPMDNDISVTFYNAGHVAGAAAIYICGKEGAFFYSGDFSLQPQKTVEKASFPKLRPDVAVIESTYGDKLHSSRETEEKKLVEKVGEIINSGKKILIPAFALGRAQEIILILKSAINKGILPPFKIYTDGMVNDICRVYKQNPNYLKSQLSKKALKGVDIFFDDNIMAVTGKQPQREEIINSKEPCCIIASSGMLTGGSSQWYAQKLALDEGNFIALTGYQDEESPGRQLLELSDNPDDTDRVLKLGELTVPVKCGIGKFGLSAHADKTGIISLTHSLSAKKVFYIHGNTDVIHNLANEVQKEYRGQIFAPSNGDLFDISLNNPRKQLVRNELNHINKVQKLTQENINELWHFIINTYGKDRAFTVEELLFIWSGSHAFNEDDLKEAIILVNSTPYFEPELKRPFMFHAINEEALMSFEKNGPMEVNAMLSLIDSHFPKEAGIYKKGA